MSLPFWVVTCNLTYGFIIRSHVPYQGSWKKWMMLLHKVDFVLKLNLFHANISQVYLEPNRTSMTEPFCINS